LKLVKPKRLAIGDTVGIVAPSHPVKPFLEMYRRGVQNLKRLGFNVKEGRTVKLEHWGYMAGTDQQRARDINEMFADDEVKAIICAIGGSTAIRTLRHLDFDLVRKEPKVFSGISDITTYHVAFLAKTGLSGLHQSDAIFGFGQDDKSPAWKYETDLFLKATTKPEPVGELPAFTRWDVWRKGKGQGRLFGGNLPTLQSLMGTQYFPRIDEDTVFFWETMTRPVEVLDQMLVQAREAGLFDRVVGMLVGKIRGEEGGAVRDMTAEMKKVVLDVVGEYDFPIVAGVDFGHYTPNLPLPMWLKAGLDTDGPRLWLGEPFVE